MKKSLLLLLLAFVSCSTGAWAQQSPTIKSIPEPNAASSPLESDSILVTIILKHQQNKNLPEIKRILEAQGFWDQFPGPDARVVSWTLAMGLGHVIVVKIPPSAVRRINLAIENGAWGAFDSEIYLSYDYKGIWHDSMEKRAEAREDRN